MKQLQRDEAGESKAFDAAAFDSRRVPLERKVILKFHHFGGFFVEYSANISLSGMFITTDSPKPAGSVFIFEIWLGDESKLVHGLGEVVWVRQEDEGPGRPVGMGVRYLKLDEESRAIIERIVADHLKKGGQVFDFDSAAPAAESMTTVAEDEEPVAVGAPIPSQEELLVLDEEALGLSAPMEASVGAVAARAGRTRSGRGLRLAFLLIAMAAALGGAAYLYSAGLLPF